MGRCDIREGGGGRSVGPSVAPSLASLLALSGEEVGK